MSDKTDGRSLVCMDSNSRVSISFLQIYSQIITEREPLRLQRLCFMLHKSSIKCVKANI